MSTQTLGEFANEHSLDLAGAAKKLLGSTDWDIDGHDTPGEVWITRVSSELVAKSNYRALAEDAATDDYEPGGCYHGVDLVEPYEDSWGQGNWTWGFNVWESTPVLSIQGEIKSTLQAVDVYPLLCESTYSGVEVAVQAEHWAEYGAVDTIGRVHTALEELDGALCEVICEALAGANHGPEYDVWKEKIQEDPPFARMRLDFHSIAEQITDIWLEVLRELDAYPEFDGRAFDYHERRLRGSWLKTDVPTYRHRGEIYISEILAGIHAGAWEYATVGLELAAFSALVMDTVQGEPGGLVELYR